MAKNLQVVYNGAVLFDGDVDEMQWVDGPGGVAVSGKFTSKAARPSGGGLLEMLSAASKKATEAKIEEKRATLDPEVSFAPEPSLEHSL